MRTKFTEISKCKDKVSYDTKTEAQEAALEYHEGHKFGGKAYRCEFCNKYHLSTGLKRKMINIAKNRHKVEDLEYIPNKRSKGVINKAKNEGTLIIRHF